MAAAVGGALPPQWFPTSSALLPPRFLASSSFLLRSSRGWHEHSGRDHVRGRTFIWSRRFWSYPGSVRFILARVQPRINYPSIFVFIRPSRCFVAVALWRRGGGAAGSLGTRGGGGCKGIRRANSVLTIAAATRMTTMTRVWSRRRLLRRPLSSAGQVTAERASEWHNTLGTGSVTRRFFPPAAG